LCVSDTKNSNKVYLSKQPGITWKQTVKKMNNNETEKKPNYDELIKKDLKSTIKLDDEFDRPLPVLPATYI
jgi:hypothetical protein